MPSALFPTEPVVVAEAVILGVLRVLKLSVLLKDAVLLLEKLGEDGGAVVIALLGVITLVNVVVTTGSVVVMILVIVVRLDFAVEVEAGPDVVAAVVVEAGKVLPLLVPEIVLVLVPVNPGFWQRTGTRKVKYQMTLALNRRWN